MTAKLILFSLFLCLGSFSVFGQGLVPPGYLKGPSEKINNIIKWNCGSKFELCSGTFRIEPNRVLPISIVVKNNDKSRFISLHISEWEYPCCPKPIPNGFRVLGNNPQMQYAEPFEAKLFRANIKINSDKKQLLLVKILDENGAALDLFRLTINHPQYMDSTKWEYISFDESKLFDFSVPDGVSIYKGIAYKE
jgi:hypothetical protein